MVVEVVVVVVVTVFLLLYNVYLLFSTSGPESYNVFP